MRTFKPKNQLKSLRVPFSQRCVRRRVLIPPALGQRRRPSLPVRQLLLQTAVPFFSSRSAPCLNKRFHQLRCFVAESRIVQHSTNRLNRRRPAFAQFVQSESLSFLYL